MQSAIEVLLGWVHSLVKGHLPSWGEALLWRGNSATPQTGDSDAEDSFLQPDEGRFTKNERSRGKGELVVEEVSVEVEIVEDSLSPGEAIPEDPFSVTDVGRGNQFQFSSHKGSADRMNDEATLATSLGMTPLSELDEEVISHVQPMHNLIKLRLVSKRFRTAISSPSFAERRLRVLGSKVEGTFGPSCFRTDDSGDWHWHGFHREANKWVPLPSLNFARSLLPSLDPDIFKDYMVAAADGLLCINVGKSPSSEKLIVCNPLTQKVKALPLMNFSRQPVLLHVLSDGTDHFKVVVAGSAAIGTDELSLITEEYSSRTGTWTRPRNSDLQCARFGLNEYQNGALYKAGDKVYLLCVAILNSGMRGVLVYDLEMHTWFQDASSQSEIPLAIDGETETDVEVNLATTQLVGSGGKVYVFSEQEVGRDVFLCIHEFQWTGFTAVWSEVMRRKRLGGRGLSSYPENTCVALSAHELCLFNTLEHTIELLDVRNPTVIVPLPTGPRFPGCGFHSLNPIGFTFQPTFGRSV